MNTIVGKKYKHFKGTEYIILNIVKHSETLENMVVYQDLSDKNKIWVRPYDMFVDYKDVNGEMIKRFEECI
ncbi:MAG: hypothetical protein A2Y18_06850 [Clostridiales bacterium GWD2_32_19]|nr:MAG: hypothetical protein A2Y18_06850 [Clostridiales bacterium GWD2_32_19]